MGDEKSVVKIDNLDLSNLSEGASKVMSSAGKFLGYPFSKEVRELVRVESEAASRIAEAKADVTVAESKVAQAKAFEEVEQIHQRMIQGNTELGLWQQQNKERIFEIALQEVPDEVSKEPVSESLLVHLLEYGQNYDDEEMQSLWGKILAGEVAEPGSFSLRTLNSVKLLSKEDAQMFTHLCKCIWVSDTGCLLFLFDISGTDYMEDIPLRFTRLKTMAVNGLIIFDSDRGFASPTEHLKGLSYFGRKYHVERQENSKRGGGGNYREGKVILTDVGHQLVPIAGGTPVEEHRIRSIKELERQGFTVTEIE